MLSCHVFKEVRYQRDQSRALDSQNVLKLKIVVMTHVMWSGRNTVAYGSWGYFRFCAGQDFSGKLYSLQNLPHCKALLRKVMPNIGSLAKAYDSICSWVLLGLA